MKPDTTRKEKYKDTWESLKKLIDFYEEKGRREGIEEAMRVVEETKSGIEYDDGSLSKFGHTITDLILVALQMKLDTKGV